MFNQLLGLVILLFPVVLFAQTPSATPPHRCGISQEASEIIKQRMMATRAEYARQGIHNLTNGRTTTYIPVSIHNVAADATGTGRTSEQTIMAFLCGLNAIYADQNVQFFIHNQIHNRISSPIYNNASSFLAQQHIYSYRIPNTLNMIIGASLQNQRASWYDPNGDFVFLLQSMLTSQAKTEAHEIGHFFTLSHTFYGWENLDVEQLYGGGRVPNSVNRSGGWGSFTPEAAARTGSQANCTSAADGFCDTEADYYSDRKACPYNPTVTDQYGMAIDPDESNIMSYAYDACVTNFSPEQKNAIAMNIASRNWVTNTPASTVEVTGVANVVLPLDGDPLGSISNPTVRLEWSPVAGATWYYIEVFGTTLPGFWFPNTNDVIYQGIAYSGNTYFDLPTTNLVAGKRYAWRIKALNSVSTCAPISPYSKFEASSSTTTNVTDLNIHQQMSFKVNANPIVTSTIPVSIYTAADVVGSIRIYSMDGREVLTWTKQRFAQGESIVQLPAGDMPNGMYLAVFHTERGQLQQKIIVQR